jgi:hypothetical protein
VGAKWWEEDDTPPKWWPYAPLALVEAGRQLARAIRELRWEDGEPINARLDRRICELWARLYWSKYPATGRLPEPLSFAEFEAELGECLSAIGHLQAQADEVTLDRVSRVAACLQEAREVWKRWDASKDGSGSART